MIFELTEYRGGGVWSVEDVERLAPYELDTYVHLIGIKVEMRANAAKTPK